MFSFWLEWQRDGAEKMNQNLLDIVKTFQPDIIYMQLQETDVVRIDTLRYIKINYPKIKIINWCGDYRNYLIKGFCEAGKVADISLLSNMGQIASYRNIGVKRLEYLQIGTDPTIYKPLNIPKKNMIVFGGNRNDSFPASKERTDLVNALRKKYNNDFVVYGMGWGFSEKFLLHEHYNKVLNEARITIGINFINDLELYFSERQLMMMGAGSLHICHYVPRLEHYFQNGIHCLWYRSIEQALDLIEISLNQSADWRNNIGLEGSKEVHKNHSWEVRFRQVLEML